MTRVAVKARRRKTTFRFPCSSGPCLPAGSCFSSTAASGSRTGQSEPGTAGVILSRASATVAPAIRPKPIWRRRPRPAFRRRRSGRLAGLCDQHGVEGADPLGRAKPRLLSSQRLARIPWRFARAHGQVTAILAFLPDSDIAAIGHLCNVDHRCPDAGNASKERHSCARLLEGNARSRAADSQRSPASVVAASPAKQFILPPGQAVTRASGVSPSEG